MLVMSYALLEYLVSPYIVFVYIYKLYQYMIAMYDTFFSYLFNSGAPYFRKKW